MIDISSDPQPHASNARRGSGASSGSEPQRQRVLRACSACHIRRTRCDGQPRCSSCRENGFPCFYVPTNRKRGPPKGCPARGGVRKKVRDNVEAINVRESDESPAKEHKKDEQPIRSRSSSSSSSLTASGARDHEYLYTSTSPRVTQAYKLHHHHRLQPTADVNQSQAHTSSHDHPYNNVRRQRHRSNASALPPISDFYTNWTADLGDSPPSASGATSIASTSDYFRRMPPSPSQPIRTTATGRSMSVSGLPALPVSVPRPPSSSIVSVLHPPPSITETGAAHSGPSIPGPPLMSSRHLSGWAQSFSSDDGLSLPPLISSLRSNSRSNANAMPSLSLSPPLPPPLPSIANPKGSLEWAASTSSASAGRSVTVPREMVDDWLSIYETIIHTQWPIFYRSGPDSVRDLEFQHQLLYDAILAISSTCHRQKSEQSHSDQRSSSSSPSSSPRHKRYDPYSRKMSESLIESVRTRILGAGVGRPLLEHVQALIIVTLFDLGAGQASTAYQMGGIACRMACDLGLHMLRPPTATDSLSEVERQTHEEEKRVLWACYVLDKILSALLQRPPGLRSCDIDTPKPAVEDYDEDTPKFVGAASDEYVAPNAREKMSYAKSCALSTFNSWCDVMKNLETILDELYRPAAYSHRLVTAKKAFQSKDGTTAISTSTTSSLQEQNQFVERMDRSLTAWRQRLPRFLFWYGNDGPDEHLYTAPNILNLRGWYYICKLLLHRTLIPSWIKTQLDHVDGNAHCRQSSDEYNDRHAFFNSLANGRDANRFEDETMAEAIRNKERGRSPEATIATSIASSLPRDLSATRQAADCICQIIEGYLTTFREKNVSAAWIYFVFHAGAIHAALASPSSYSMLSSVVERQRQSSIVTGPDDNSDIDTVEEIISSSQHNLNRCIAWLDQMSIQWKNADHHVRVLKDLSSVGCPLSSSRPGDVQAHHLPNLSHQSDYESRKRKAESVAKPDASTVPTNDLLMIKSQLLFWGTMPTSSEDFSLWKQFHSRFGPVR